MSIIAKLMDTLRLNPDEDDEEYLDDAYEDEDDFEDQRYSSRRSVSDDYEEEPQGKSKLFGRSTPKVIQMKQKEVQPMQVTMLRPTSMEDSKEIVGQLREGKAVVLNLEGIHLETAQRIIDFAAGATCSIDGNLQKISGGIFIVTPESVTLEGAFQGIQSAGADMGMSSIPGMRVHM